MDEDKRTASEALACINKLYHIENEAKEAGIAGDALKEKRQKVDYNMYLFDFEIILNSLVFPDGTPVSYIKTMVRLIREAIKEMMPQSLFRYRSRNK